MATPDRIPKRAAVFKSTATGLMDGVAAVVRDLLLKGPELVVFDFVPVSNPFEQLEIKPTITVAKIGNTILSFIK